MPSRPPAPAASPAPPLPPLLVDPRYEGPPDCANGGLAGGLMAAYVARDPAAQGAAEVTLRAPVPLGRALSVERAPDGTLLFLDTSRPDDDTGDPTLVAEVRGLPLPALAVPRVTRAEAEAAPSPSDHPHDRCFVCGTHTPGGLRFQPRPGRLDPAAVVPAGEEAGGPWRLWTAPFDARADVCDAAGRLRPEIVWGLLDCSGSWVPANRRPPWSMRTGRLHGAVRAPVHAGERCVVVAWSLGRERRKHLVGSAVLGEDGSVRAEAAATWIIPREGSQE